MSEEIKPRVLVIDDEESVRIWLKGLLVSLGCEVVGEAKNGQEGVELFKRERPDLVLLDLQMPVMNGDEALDHIIIEDPDAYVIILTSVSDAKVIIDDLMAGARYYLPKHDPPEMIQAALQEQIEKVKSKTKR
ncbi:MAG: response regulator transcription factor [Acidiferrobacterales bacterium]|nr:response regulator transcription factor [Pseudomonadota bacterium]